VAKTITYKKLYRILLNRGYTITHRGGHIVVSNPSTTTLIVLPKKGGNYNVGLHHIAVIKRILRESDGICDEQFFSDLESR